MDVGLRKESSCFSGKINIHPDFVFSSRNMNFGG